MKVTISKKGSSWDFDSDRDESVLYAGLRQGLNLSYECATGTCGTCKARLVSGDLDQGWDQAPGRSYIKSERGEFLMCQSRALSDCNIRVPGEVRQLSSSWPVPEHYSGKLKNPRPLTHDVTRFDIELDRPIQFLAGQFVAIETPFVKGFRAYSMVNYNQRTSTLELVIKRFPDGKFSDWLFDDLIAESSVSVFGPLGAAVFEPELDKDLMCIAGGSGIAGMMSILTHGCQDQYFADHKAHLFFGVRAPKDIFFYPELLAMTRQFPDTLSVTIALSEEHDGLKDLQSSENLHFTTGFVHEAARQCRIEKDRCMAYVAGPPLMVNAALRDLLGESGFSPEQIRYDKFG